MSKEESKREIFRFQNEIEYNSKTQKWKCENCDTEYNTALEAVKCDALYDEDDYCGWRFDH